MNVKNVFTMGFLSMIIAATGLPAAAEGVTADLTDMSRVDVIDTIDGEEAKGSQGPTYSYTIPMSH